MRLYIDPGTGSMLFATLIGLVGLAGYFFKGLWLKLKFVLNGGKKSKSNDDVIPFVIYSDDKRYWPVFEPICCELNIQGFDTVYMTASPDDPALQNQYEHIHAEFIGQGNKSFVKLNFLKATLVLSTTPGLDVYQWKRSRDVKYYIHIPHMPGELTTYRMFGIDYYDALLLSGQYQIDDVRALEKLRGLPEKECTIVGIPYLDEMVKRLNTTVVEKHECTVLVAPSWGKNSLLNRFGNKLIDQLIASKYHIIVRPHPQSFTSEKALIDRLMKEYPNLEWNRDVDNFDVLNRSDIMISDFSGVIFDFALVFEKPVICAYTDFDKSQYDAWWLDTPIWTSTAIPRLGPILNESNLSELKQMIDTTLDDPQYKDTRHEVREETWANQGHSATLTAKYITEKYQSLISESITTPNDKTPSQDKPDDKNDEINENEPTVANKPDEISNTQTDQPSGKKLRKRYVTILILIIICVVIVVANIVIQKYFAYDTEKALERNDLELMRSAENLAKNGIDSGQINEKSEYWLECNTVMKNLLSASYGKPKAYGQGTTMVGGAAKEYYKDGVPYYQYDESQDYTDKIIKVTVDPETKDIIVEWVN